MSDADSILCQIVDQFRRKWERYLGEPAAAPDEPSDAPRIEDELKTVEPAREPGRTARRGGSSVVPGCSTKSTRGASRPGIGL